MKTIKSALQFSFWMCIISMIGLGLSYIIDSKLFIEGVISKSITSLSLLGVLFLLLQWVIETAKPRWIVILAFIPAFLFWGIASCLFYSFFGVALLKFFLFWSVSIILISLILALKEKIKEKIINFIRSRRASKIMNK